MTEKELSELYTRLALQFDSVLGTLVSKNLVFTDSVPGIRKDFYDSLNEEKRKDFERILTYTQIIRRYIRENANNGPISLTQLAKQYSEESPGYMIQSWMRSRNMCWRERCSSICLRSTKPATSAWESSFPLWQSRRA